MCYALLRNEVHMYEVMTTEQLASYLQLDEQTVYRKAKRGEIPVVRIGKTLRFKKEMIDSWLRLSSLQWNAKKRSDLRKWAQSYARTKKIKEEDVLGAIKRRRKLTA